MYSQQNNNNSTAMAPPQKPETFMLSNEAQQSLPQDAQVALQQVDNCKMVLSAPGALPGSPAWAVVVLFSQRANTLRSKILPHLCAC